MSTEIDIIQQPRAIVTRIGSSLDIEWAIQSGMLTTKMKRELAQLLRENKLLTDRLNTAHCAIEDYRDRENSRRKCKKEQDRPIAMQYFILGLIAGIAITLIICLGLFKVSI